jgi:hypothetical protein
VHGTTERLNQVTYRHFFALDCRGTVLAVARCFHPLLKLPSRGFLIQCSFQHCSSSSFHDFGVSWPTKIFPTHNTLQNANSHELGTKIYITMVYMYRSITIAGSDSAMLKWSKKLIKADQIFSSPSIEAYAMNSNRKHDTLIFQIIRDSKMFISLTDVLFLVIPHSSNNMHVLITSRSNLAR